MIIKSWYNYSLKCSNRDDQRNNRKKGIPFESLNNSCASDLSEAKYQKFDENKQLTVWKGPL